MRPWSMLGTEAPRGRGLLKRYGAAAFLFFLVKGLLWLALPAAVFLSRG